MESKEVCKTGILLMTGYAGLKGTQELISTRNSELRKKFSNAFLNRTGQICKIYSGQKAQVYELLCAKTGMNLFPYETYSSGSNGIFADLWEFADSLNLGLEVDLRKIPIRQETIEIANFLDINPYEISSEGSILICTDQNRASVIPEIFLQNGINADEIGSFDHGNDRVLINKGARRYLTPLSRIEDEKRLRSRQKSGQS